MQIQVQLLLLSLPEDTCHACTVLWQHLYDACVIQKYHCVIQQITYVCMQAGLWLNFTKVLCITLLDLWVSVVCEPSCCLTLHHVLLPVKKCSCIVICMGQYPKLHKLSQLKCSHCSTGWLHCSTSRDVFGFCGQVTQSGLPVTESHWVVAYAVPAARSCR